MIRPRPKSASAGRDWPHLATATGTTCQRLALSPFARLLAVPDRTGLVISGAMCRGALCKDLALARIKEWHASVESTPAFDFGMRKGPFGWEFAVLTLSDCTSWPYVTTWGMTQRSENQNICNILIHFGCSFVAFSAVSSVKAFGLFQASAHHHTLTLTRRPSFLQHRARNNTNITSLAQLLHYSIIQGRHWHPFDQNSASKIFKRSANEKTALEALRSTPSNRFTFGSFGGVASRQWPAEDKMQHYAVVRYRTAGYRRDPAGIRRDPWRIGLQRNQPSIFRLCWRVRL